VNKLRSEAFKNQAEGAVLLTGDRTHESKMQDVRALVNQRYGGKLNMLNDEVIGADRDGWDFTLNESDRLLKENPGMSSADAFGQASRAYLAQRKPANAKPGQPAQQPQFIEGKVYQDANGNKAKWVNGTWQPLH
jgi:hypothetical protein